MIDGTNDLVVGFLLAFAFAHLIAATLERADWARLRRAYRAVLLRGIVTVLIALKLTGGHDFVRWLQDGTWMVGALCLLIVPAVLGRFAEHRLAVSQLGCKARGRTTGIGTPS